MPVELPEGWEDWLAYFAASLPAPVAREETARGGLLFTAGAPPEVLVELRPSCIRVARVLRLGADGRHVRHSRWIARVYWPHANGRRAQRVVEQVIDLARRARRAEYRRCFVCDRRLPPELMSDADTCRRCAAR